MPTAPLTTLDPRPSWGKAPETGLRVTWLGHSTLLVELDGVRVLTDPVWGERVSPVGFAGPKRWGTFHLAMHDWDEPAEVLLKLGSGLPLLMPQLGEAAEPTRSGAPSPWWRTPGTALEGSPAAEAEPPATALDAHAPLAFPLD